MAEVLSGLRANRSSLPQVVVAGVGRTPFGRLPGHDAASLGQWALSEALADCGLVHGDIDGLILNRIGDYQDFARQCGIDPRLTLTTPPHGRFSGVCIQAAVAALQTGQADRVALVYGNDGQSAGMRYAAGSYDAEQGGVWFPYGMTSPSAFHALMMRRHMHLHGSTEAQLGAIATTFRGHAALNDAAVMREPLSLAQYFESPWVCEPLRRHDHCLINDGGVAMVLTRAEQARDLRQPPVAILGVGQASSLSDSAFPPEDFWAGAMGAATRDSFRMAGLSHADIDALMIYDNFTPTVLFALEGAGYCPMGRAGPWVEEGHLGLGARYPANTSGGHLSESYMQGWSLQVEAVLQLRGAAGARQVGNAAHVHYLAAAPVCTSIVYGRVQR